MAEQRDQHRQTEHHSDLTVAREVSPQRRWSRHSEQTAHLWMHTKQNRTGVPPTPPSPAPNIPSTPIPLPISFWGGRKDSVKAFFLLLSFTFFLPNGSRMLLTLGYWLCCRISFLFFFFSVLTFTDLFIICFVFFVFCCWCIFETGLHEQQQQTNEQKEHSCDWVFCG